MGGFIIGAILGAIVGFSIGGNVYWAIGSAVFGGLMGWGTWLGADKKDQHDKKVEKLLEDLQKDKND